MQRPNILILYTDQQRWDGVGINGNREIQTPNLDELAAYGANFSRCFVQNPVCMPSRASFLTGQYPSTLGITHMGVPLPQNTLTLPRLLSPYGYHAANIGKLHFLPHANRDHRELHPRYGFDHLEISDEPGTYEDAYRAWVRKQAPEELDNISVGLAPMTEVWYEAMNVDDRVSHPAERFPKRPIPTRCPDELTHTAFVAEQSISYMRSRARSGDPFLCVAGIYSPHSPWVAPQQYFDLYDPEALSVPDFPPEVNMLRGPDHFSDGELRLARQGYYGQIGEVDYQVGRILAALKEMGLERETLVIFTSDHGEWLGEHLRYGKGYPAHDACSRVPLIVRWPDEIEAGQDSDALVEAVDVVPTILEAIGVQTPPHLQGRSLLPSMQNQPFEARTTALTEHTGWKSLRSDRFRYVLRSDGQEHLFNLEAPWGSYRDIGGDEDSADFLSEHRFLLAKRQLSSERPLPRIWPY